MICEFVEEKFYYFKYDKKNELQRIYIQRWYIGSRVFLEGKPFKCKRGGYTCASFYGIEGGVWDYFKEMLPFFFEGKPIRTFQEDFEI